MTHQKPFTSGPPNLPHISLQIKRSLSHQLEPRSPFVLRKIIDEKIKKSPSPTHVDPDSSQVFGCVSRRLSEGKERHPNCAGISGEVVLSPFIQVKEIPICVSRDF